jgi:glycosyltransferase involved in cell wall biosynthesis
MSDTPNRNLRAVRVNFLEGMATHAPGVARAQESLVEALSQATQYDIRATRFTVPDPRLWFPTLYGVMPAWFALNMAPLTHIGNAWYGHLVPLLKRPTIVTCFDVIELEELQSGARRFRVHRKFHVQAAFTGMLKARFIACVSRSTAERVVCHAPQTEHRVRVIPCGLSRVFSPGPTDQSVLRRYEVKQPYVLYVGSEQPRKNLPQLVAALAEVKRTVPELRFVKVGASQTVNGRTEFLSALDRAGMRGQATLIEEVSDQELLMLYRGATVTALMSLAEGFGYPPLEAMACGCPTIVSNEGALAEVTGGAALVADPRDTRSIARTIERVVGDPSVRRDLIGRGTTRAGTFTWERAAEQYAALYEEALSTP